MHHPHLHPPDPTGKRRPGQLPPPQIEQHVPGQRSSPDHESLRERPVINDAMRHRSRKISVRANQQKHPDRHLAEQVSRKSLSRSLCEIRPPGFGDPVGYVPKDQSLSVLRSSPPDNTGSPYINDLLSSTPTESPPPGPPASWKPPAPSDLSLASFTPQNVTCPSPRRDNWLHLSIMPCRYPFGGSYRGAIRALYSPASGDP